MGFVVDQAHLANVVSGLHGCQNDFTTALVGRDDARAPRQNDGKCIGFFALLDDGLAALEAVFDHRFRHRFSLRSSQH